MKRLTKIGFLVAVLVPFSIAGDGVAVEAGSTPESELLATAVAWDAAFNSEDLDGLMALYADGAVEMPPGFPVLVGKADIRADYEFLFENFDFHHQTTVVQLEIHGAMSVERGEYTMLVAPADGSPAFVETGRHLIVREKINGSWVSILETWHVD